MAETTTKADNGTFLTAVSGGDQLTVKKDTLTYLYKLTETVLKSKEENDYLSICEPLVYLALEYKKTNETEDLGFDITAITINFLERLNGKSVQLFNGGKVEEAAKVIARAMDLIGEKNLKSLIPNETILSEKKILIYNNVSCIFRMQGKLQLALKVLNSTLELEEKLAESEIGGSEISVIGTFLNKSAILSEMKQYDSAIEAVNKGLSYIKKVEEKPSLSPEQKKHLKELYTLNYYSLAVEYEHKNDKEKSLQYYEESLKYAKETNKVDMIKKIEKALAYIKEKK